MRWSARDNPLFAALGDVKQNIGDKDSMASWYQLVSGLHRRSSRQTKSGIEVSDTESCSGFQAGITAEQAKVLSAILFGEEHGSPVVSPSGDVKCEIRFRQARLSSHAHLVPDRDEDSQI
jgi:hypothetical protein